MSTRQDLIDDYVDGLSAAHSREILKNLVRAYVLRQKDAGEEQKYAGRAAQKRIAQILIDSDADWALRQFILNAGRTLYYSESEMHPYYRDELLALVDRLGEALGDPVRTASVRKALVEYDRAVRATPDGADARHLLHLSAVLVDCASALVNDVLTNVPDFELKRSEIRPLTGIVNPATWSRILASRETTVTGGDADES